MKTKEILTNVTGNGARLYLKSVGLKYRLQITGHRLQVTGKKYLTIIILLTCDL